MRHGHLQEFHIGILRSKLSAHHRHVTPSTPPHATRQTFVNSKTTDWYTQGFHQVRNVLQIHHKRFEGTKQHDTAQEGLDDPN